MPSEWTVALGEGAELLADKYSISRDEQDEFALGSHQRAHAAWDGLPFDAEVVPVDGNGLARDESIRPDTSPSRSWLRCAGVPRRRHGHRRQLVADERRRRMLLSCRETVARTGATPLARVRRAATSGVEPHRYGIGPVGSRPRALQRPA